MEGRTMSATPPIDGAPKSGHCGGLPAALDLLCDRLVQSMHPDGFWEGRLSASALSTATAVSALSLAKTESDGPRIAAGAAWLVEHQNQDHGWGDTTDSPSNLATTLLSVAALRLAAAAGVGDARTASAMAAAHEYLAARDAGNPQDVVAAISREYGGDRTFAVPILMNLALAELVSWGDIADLPFELAALPHRWYKALRLHVVSYALPALIAIGLLIDRRHPPRNPLRRWIRQAITPAVLKKLEQIQPPHGGFLEATPLTSFVAMGLIPLFGREQPVAAKCLDFLRQSLRPEGSWPIDTNLSVWLTTAAVAALAGAGALSRIDGPRTARWIAARQGRTPHPYTQAAAGGWAWTHLPGGVPDADDTAGAIIALTTLAHREGIEAGIGWLLDLQNGDGGWPTFCRGWGKLPFDQSAPDLTAHALRALWAAGASTTTGGSRRAIQNGLRYLHRSQQPDGAWRPLWFGNQQAPGLANPVLGTSRVLRALEIVDSRGPLAAGGVKYLLGCQNADGGWGGARGVPSSQEETALAVAALAPWSETPATAAVLFRGVEYLLRGSHRGVESATPIGLYFSHLWYSEALYPLIWTIEALGRARRLAPIRYETC
jgi:squalene-hopene/tetraprenyl-beta-curcumene cyclase